VRSRVRIGERALAFPVAAVMATVGLVLPYGTVMAQPVVTATVLGTFGGTMSQALDINESGQVVGHAYTNLDAAYHAFSWTSSGGMVDLGTLGGTYSSATAVSESGVVVGSSGLSDGETHAFSWTQADGMVDLGTLGGTVSEASGVADDGRITGYSFIAGDAAIHGFSWTEDDGMVDLGTLGGSSAQPNAGGANGRIVGLSAVTGDTANHAFVWTEAGGMLDLGTLGGANSRAYAVNGAGQVVGEAWTTGDAESHAFSWTEATGMVDLGTLGGLQSQTAFTGQAVNASGQVVGTSALASGDQHAFLWTDAGSMVDLGTLGGTLSSAYAVNDGTEVVGLSFTAGSASAHPFWWSPGDGMLDLDALGATTDGVPNAISNQGIVVGWSTVAGNVRGTLWTVGQPGGTDADGDGIENWIDVQPGTPSSAFQDAATTAGTIGAIPADMTVTVNDAANPLGVHVVTTGATSGSLSIALTNPISPATPCGTVELSSPADVELTCGSITVHVIAGSASVRLSNDTTAVVGGGETARISVSAGGAFTIESVVGGDGKVTVVDDGVATDVGPSATPINLWDFVGFSSPVDNPPILNTVKPGSVVPLRWRLLAETGSPITNLGSASVSTAVISCPGSAGVDAIEEVASSPSPLVNHGNGNYSLNWKTEKSWSGCVQMRLKLAGEGPIAHVANFKFK
jgi:probable HAF family extracellular repeat protein